MVDVETDPSPAETRCGRSTPKAAVKAVLKYVLQAFAFAIPVAFLALACSLGVQQAVSTFFPGPKPVHYTIIGGQSILIVAPTPSDPKTTVVIMLPAASSLTPTPEEPTPSVTVKRVDAQPHPVIVRPAHGDRFTMELSNRSTADASEFTLLAQYESLKFARIGNNVWRLE